MLKGMMDVSKHKNLGVMSFSVRRFHAEAAQPNSDRVACPVLPCHTTNSMLAEKHDTLYNIILLVSLEDSEAE